MANSKRYSKLKNVGFVLILLALIGLTSGTTVFGEGCQYCWTSGEYGQCLDVLNPNPGMMTYANCTGIKRCFPIWGSQDFCYAACTGSQCYWV